MKDCLRLAGSVVLLFAACSRSEKTPAEHAADQPEKKKIVEISEDARKKSGISIETAGPAVLRKTLTLNGKIGPNEERMAHVSPRFAGIVKSIAKRLGENVKTG